MKLTKPRSCGLVLLAVFTPPKGKKGKDKERKGHTPDQDPGKGKKGTHA